MKIIIQDPIITTTVEIQITIIILPLTSIRDSTIKKMVITPKSSINTTERKKLIGMKIILVEEDTETIIIKNLEKIMAKEILMVKTIMTPVKNTIILKEIKLDTLPGTTDTIGKT
jgi:hypothetical protein